MSQYSKAVYDTNCIIYYRFHCKVRVNGKEIVLKPPQYEKIDKITSKFLNQRIEIHTLKIALDEIYKKGIPQIVEEFLRNKYGGKNNFYILVRNCTVKIKNSIQRLKTSNWFRVVDFSPQPNIVAKVRNFYASLPYSGKKQRLIDKNNDPYPSYVDLSLIIYSGEIQSPLVTNDSDIYDFEQELVHMGYCYKIIKL